MPKYDSIIFDLDGTLWDSASVCAEAWNNALQKLRMPYREITVSDISRIMGMPHKQVFETVFPDKSEGEREVIAETCYEQEIRAIEVEGAAIYPGVADGIHRLAAKYPLFVVSNCLTEYLEVFLEVSGFRSYFKDSECHGNTGLAKWQNIRDLVARNHLKKPVYVGDTGSDQDSAARAGVDFIFVSYGFGHAGKPCESFADFPSLTEHLLHP